MRYSRVLTVRLSVIAVVSLLAGVFACTSAPGDEGPGNSRLSQVLKFVPDTPDNRSNVLIVDYVRAREVSGASLPAPEAGSDEVLAYVVALQKQRLIGAGGFMSGMDQYVLQTPITRANVGFGAQDVDVDLTAGKPPYTLEVVSGRLDGERSAGAISLASAASPAVSSRYASEDYKGVTIHSWGSGLDVNLAERLSPPVFDSLGRAMPMAVLDEYALRYPTVEGIKGMIDVGSGDRDRSNSATRSLAVVREYKLLAETCASNGAACVLMSDQVQNAGSFPAQASDGSPLLRPYLALAVGTGGDEKGLYALAVLVHASADLAQQNIDLLKRRIAEASSQQASRPWRELIPEADVQSDGTILIAKLRTASVTLALQAFYARDPLLLSEGGVPPTTSAAQPTGSSGTTYPKSVTTPIMTSTTPPLTAVPTSTMGFTAHIPKAELDHSIVYPLLGKIRELYDGEVPPHAIKGARIARRWRSGPVYHDNVVDEYCC